MRLRIALLMFLQTALASAAVPGFVTAAPSQNDQVTIGAAPNPIAAGEGALIFTVPEQTAKRLVPGSPRAKMVVPRLMTCGMAKEFNRSSNSGPSAPKIG